MTLRSLFFGFALLAPLAACTQDVDADQAPQGDNAVVEADLATGVETEGLPMGVGVLHASTYSGAACAFAVDGVAKGTTNSITVSLLAGSHSLTCRRAHGVVLSQRSRNAVIKPEETAMVMFKL